MRRAEGELRIVPVRFIWLLFGLVPLGIAIASLIVDSRIDDGRWATPATILFGIAAFLSLTNFYLSFIRYPLHRLVHRRTPYR